MKARFVALALAAPLVANAAPYTPSGTCGPFPKVDVAVPAGYCMALVADNTRGLRFPRRIVELAPNRFWIIDMGNWEPRQGRLLEMTLNESAADPAKPASTASLYNLRTFLAPCFRTVVPSVTWPSPARHV